MTFHKAKEEYKWKQWKEQEERILRKSGVSEEVIQRLRELDWQDFNAERRFWEHFSSNQEELYTRELEEQSPVVLNIQQLLDSVENEQLLRVLLKSDKKTLQILLLKERLERCSPSARGHSQPQIHSRDNHAARAAHRPACSHAPHGRCGADERGLAMVSLYPLWKADDYTGQPRRGQDLLCHASCGGLHQPKALARYGDP